MISVPNQICEFEASWNTTGQIWIDNKICDRCLQEKECICIDSSDGEYGEGAICFECIEEAKNKFINKKPPIKGATNLKESE